MRGVGAACTGDEQCQHCPMGDDDQIAGGMLLNHSSDCGSEPRVGLVGGLVAQDQLPRTLEQASDPSLELLPGAK